MAAIDFCELSIEQEEYLVELLCTRGACTVDWLARELDEACRAGACIDTWKIPSNDKCESRPFR